MEIVVKTSIVSSASGSAYLEEQNPDLAPKDHRGPPEATLKILCAVHGPRPLRRSTPFNPLLKLSLHVRFAPLASNQKIDPQIILQERDLSIQIENALRGIVIADRWPKSGMDVVITIIEMGKQYASRDGDAGLVDLSKVQVCSGCISAASAAVVDAGVDCYDIVTGGVSAICRRDPPAASPASKTGCDVASDFLDLNTGPVVAACLVGYSESRDELTELWISGSASSTETTGSNFNAHMEPMIDQAVENAKFNRLVLVESLKGTTLAKSGHLNAT